MDNLMIYEKARSVPQEARKSITAGRLKGMTDINPMFRIKCLTEMFGPCGVGWWYEITDKHFVSDELTKQVAAFVDILLYYVDPESGATSHAIPGTGGASFVAQERNGPYMSDECYKMALTDAISVAAKALGVGADVYWEKDRSKYSSDAEPAEPTETAEPTKFIQYTAQAHSFQPPVMFKCEECGEVLVPYDGVNGKTVGVRQHSEASKSKFGRVLCIDCIKKLQGEAM